MPAPWFSVWEFRCKSSGLPYPQEWVDTRLAKLLRTLDPIRGKWNDKIQVISGYRDPEYNLWLYQRSEARAKAAGRAHGGVALFSEHVNGIAADIAPLSNPSPPRVAMLHDLVLAMYAGGELEDLGGLGLYPGWIHVDVRDRGPGGRLARWNGEGAGDLRTR